MKKLSLSCDSFTAAYSFLLLLFFVPYAAFTGNILAAAFVPLCLIIPYGVMPLLYAAVHRFDTLLFGRYHLFMPLSGFLSAFFFVMMFSAAGSAPSDACLIFFGALLFSVSSMLYRYCSFSVRARLIGDGVSKPSVMSRAFAALGAATAIASIFGFSRGGEAALLNTAYVIATLAVIATAFQYLTSFYGIPRLGGKRVQPIKSVYASLYSGLNVRLFVSSMLYMASAAAVAALVVCYCAFTVDAPYLWLIAASVAAAVYCVTSWLCSDLIKRRSRALSITVFVGLAAAAVLMILCAALRCDGDTAIALSVCACVAAAASGAVAARQTRLRFLTIKPRVTSGTVYILLRLAAYAAAALALAVAVSIAAAFYGGGTEYSFIYGFAAAAVFAVAALALSGKKRIKPEPAPEPSIELEGDAVGAFDGDNGNGGGETDETADGNTAEETAETAQADEISDGSAATEDCN